MLCHKKAIVLLLFLEVLNKQSILEKLLSLHKARTLTISISLVNGKLLLKELMDI